MIPDIKLHEIVKACIRALRADFDQNGSVPSDTIIWYLLNDQKMSDTGKFKWYEQAVEIFINRKESNPKYLDTRLFFDRERASVPTVHVMMSGENKGADGIGVDLGFRPEQVIGESQRSVFNRQFDINANIVITSDNTFETVIIYHVLKSMMISLMNHIQLVGFINPVISGRDITLSQELVPNGKFLGKTVGLPLTSHRRLVLNGHANGTLIIVDEYLSGAGISYSQTTFPLTRLETAFSGLRALIL